MVVAKIATTSQHGAIPGKTQDNESMFYNLDVINWQLDLETYIRQREPEQSELIVQTKVQRDLFQSAIIALWNNL